MVRKNYGDDESSDQETTMSFEVRHQEESVESPVTIEVFSLTKVFVFAKAVDTVSFNASRGEVIAFLGYSGAGKSVLLNMLCGLATPTSGTALIGKRPVITELSSIYA